MAEVTMTQNREWLLQAADEEAHCEVSARAAAHETGLRRRSDLSETAIVSLGKFLELSRRQMNESPEGLAKKAGVDSTELMSLECGKSPVRNPKILSKIAAALNVEVQPLLELAGLITTTDQRLVRIAAQFLARLESVVKPSARDEEQVLAWFKEQVSPPRSNSVAG